MLVTTYAFTEIFLNETTIRNITIIVVNATSLALLNMFGAAPLRSESFPQNLHFYNMFILKVMIFSHVSCIL